MNDLQRVAARGLAVAFLALLPVSVVQAEEPSPWRRSAARRPPAAFEVAGAFGGVLAGRVHIGGVDYPMSPTLQVYQLGTGLVPIDQIPIGTVVYASGAGRAETGSVSTLIARPVDETSGRAHRAPRARERDTNRPQ
jgi:hypothetical protein